MFAVSCSSVPPVQEPGGEAAIRYAGARSSSYGIRPFPEPESWDAALRDISDRFPGSAPCAVWIVGELADGHGCHLFFPSEGRANEHVFFDTSDKHERFLRFFDEVGIKVFLQVEPGNADVPSLIDLVLSRYGHHPSVVGFGVDVEWYGQGEERGWGIPVEDDVAQQWELLVKSYNSSYRLFLKHWDRGWMPKTFRGDIVFVSDSQQLANLDAMVNEFTGYWAGYFAPNPVYFQIGYPADKVWWSQLKDPVRQMGNEICGRVAQECGIFWVDFTFRDVVDIP